MVLITWLISLSELYNSADVASRKGEVETFNKVSHKNIFSLGSSVHAGGCEVLQIPYVKIMFTSDCGYSLTEGKPLAEAWAHYVPSEVWVGIWVPLHCVCEYLLCGWDGGNSPWWSGDWTGDQHQGIRILELVHHRDGFIFSCFFFFFC